MLKLIHRISLMHLVTLSFVLNLIMYCAVGSWNQDVEKNIVVTRDAAGYELLAKNILHYHTFAGAYDTANIPLNSPELKGSYLIVNYDTYREPVYPGFLALIYFITGVKPFVAIFLQLILNTFSVILVYRIAMLLFDNKNVATLAGLIYALDIHAIFVANTLLSDTLFVFLFFLSLFYFLSGIKKKSVKEFIASAVFTGLASLTRPVLLLYPFVLIFFMLLFNRNLGFWIIKTMALYLIIAYSIIGTWAIRNHNTYGRWQLNTMNGYNLLMANVAITESRKTSVFIEEVRAKLDVQCDSLGCLKTKNPFDRSNICEKVAWNYIVKNKMDYIETQIWGGIHMFLSLGNIDMAQHLGWSSSDVEGQLIMDSKRLEQNFAHKKQAVLGVLIILMLIIQYTGAFIGLFELVKKRKYRTFAFSVFTILYFIAITGAIGKYRYKLPMQVAICTISAYGYCSILKRKSVARSISPNTEI
jgi:4-amino-4-deoxy-L-arabinose transferase-like glycosyltransferase